MMTDAMQQSKKYAEEMYQPFESKRNFQELFRGTGLEVYRLGESVCK
jgi:hypothetical protein